MNKSIKLGPRTPESRKALHLMTVDSASIVPTLGLPPPLDEPCLRKGCFVPHYSCCGIII